jgi:hypothetical protein
VIVANRFLVWWDEELTGRHYEARSDPDAADRLLREKEQRDLFLRGAVLDTAQWTSDPDEFLRRHESTSAP